MRSAIALLLLAASSAAAQDPPPPPRRGVTSEWADRAVAAFGAKDDAALDFLRARPISAARDPFLVANELLRRHAEGSLRDPPEPGPFLDAAAALARRVKDLPEDAYLPALVESWRGLGKDALRAELAAQAVLIAVEEPGGGARREELLGTPPVARGLTGTRLHYYRAAWLAEVGRTAEAVEAYAAAHDAAAEVGWTAGETSLLWEGGYLHYRRGDLAEARRLWREQLAVADARFSRWAQPEILRWVATAEAAFGNHVYAADLLRRGIEIAREGGDTWQEAQCAEFLGRMHAAQGRYAEALYLLEGARRTYLHPESPSRLGAANCLEAMGAIWTEVGRPARAVPALEEALSELEAIGYRADAARARANLGAAYEALGRGDDALRELEGSLAGWEALHDRLGAARTLALLGDLHLRAGRLDRALDCQQRSLELVQGLGNRTGAVRATAALGEVRAARGEHDLALELAVRARTEATANGDRRGAARALRGMAAALRALARPAEALASARESVDLQASLGTGLGEEDAAGLRRDVQAAADTGLLAALELSRASPSAPLGDAFHLAESSRGLLLAEGLVNREALLSASVPVELREREAEARARVAALARTMDDPAALDEACIALEYTVALVQREARKVADVVYPRPVALADFQAALPATDALVLYRVTPERAFALVVTRDSADLLDLGDSKPLAASAAAWVDLVSVDGSEEETRAAALYDALLRPVEKAVAGRTRLLVCPDGVLSFLPFEALLRTGGERPERAVERWEMAYVPSATVLSIQRAAKEAPGTGILAIGDPVYPGEAGMTPVRGRDAEIRGMGILRRLPGTAAEVRGIAALAPSGTATLLLRERATAGALREALAGTKGRLAALHLACHGHLDAGRPRLSGLVLSGGEVLGLDDVYRMKIPADLVVLSACASARGRILDGEGAMGLARGFFFAGARRVVVSDWAVSDEATRAFMGSFYRRLLREGRTPAAALRAAKIEALRSGGPLAHPSHWAAFVIWGD